MSRRSDTTKAMIAFTASITAVTLWVNAESSAIEKDSRSECKEATETSMVSHGPRSTVSPLKNANRCAHSAKGVGFPQEPHHE